MAKVRTIHYPQRQLPLKGSSARAIRNPFRVPQLLIIGSLTVLFINALTYTILMGLTVAHAGQARTFEHEARTVRSSIAGLERTVRQNQERVTKDRASEFGLTVRSTRVFVESAPLVASQYAQ